MVMETPQLSIQHPLCGRAALSSPFSVSGNKNRTPLLAGDVQHLPLAANLQKEGVDFE